jgi:putative ABC transport system permease protein
VTVPPLRQVLRGLRALVHARQTDAELADEVEHYVAEASAAHEARGLSPAEARRAALVDVGGAASVREQVRSSRWEHTAETVARDVRHALRRLRKGPVFTATAAVTLAVGVGASTAVFSVVNPILLEPLPFPGADRLVSVDDRNAEGVPMDATLGTYDELRARTHSFDVLAAADRWRPSLTRSGTPERLEGQRVTANYFDVFSVVPIVGRTFTVDDDQPGAANVVIVGHALAERRFGGARPALGRDVELDGDRYLVVGVLPHAFTNVAAPAAEIWSPLRERSTADLSTRMWGHHYQVIGRLHASASIDAATREILRLGETPISEFPRPRWASLSRGLLVRPLHESITGAARPALYAIVSSVALLLLMACVNVANLLLARGTQRSPEVAMCLALGASRRRVLRQVITETLVLALIGGALGLAVAQAGIRALVAVSPPGLPRIDAIHLDAQAFLFAIALSTIVGVVVGAIPARGVMRTDVTAMLRHGSGRTTPSRRKLRNVLVVAQVALALVLLVSAGLLLRSVQRLLSTPAGFDPAHLITMQVVEAGHTFDSDEMRLQFFQHALDAVRRVPGVTRASFTSQLPLSGEVDGYGYEVQQRPADKAGESGSALRYTVSADYFATMRIPLVAGRVLDATDRPGSPVAVVVNESFAKRQFGDANPIGQRVRFGPQMHGDRPWDIVVGVVGDVKHYSLAVNAPDAFYTVNGQWEWVDNVETLVVRATGRPETLVPALRRAIWSVNANVPIPRVRTMDSLVAASAGSRRFALLAIETLAIVSLLLAAVGLYGVISGSVTERNREIGIRTTLGASPGAVVRDVLRNALTLAGAGAAIGIGGAWVASRLLTTMLFGVSPLDPLTYGAVLGLLAAVALLAAWAPARRAAGIDPTIALRAD